MNVRKLIPIIISLGLLWCNAEAQELPITHYTPDSEINALPSAMVTNVYQDRQGFIWLALYSTGIVRYNGVSMELYDQEDGLDDLGIWRLFEDAAGHLWVASHAGLSVSDKPLSDYTLGSRINFTSSFNDTPLYNESLSQNQIEQDIHGMVWIGTASQGIIRYQIENSVIKTEFFSTDLNGDGHIAVTSLLAANDGTMVAALEGGSLVHVKDAESTPIYSPSGFDSDLNINSMHLDDDDTIWAYRQNGEVIYFSEKSGPPRLITETFPSNITGISSVTDGIIWATNGAYGITKIDSSTKSVIGTYSRVNGLLSNNVFDVMVDRENNIWIAQSGGLSKLRYNYSAFENFSALSKTGERPVLPSARVNSVFVPENTQSPCRLWVGTEEGATCIFDDGTSQYITQEDGLMGNWVNGLATDESGRLWIATTQGLNGIAFTGQNVIPGAENIRQIDFGGTIATLFSVPDSPPFIAAETLHVFNSNRQNYAKSAWFPGLRRLYGISGNSLYTFDSENGLPSTLYKSAAFDGDGYLWVGTLDRGIYRSSRPITSELLTAADPQEIQFELFWSRENDAPTNHIEKLFWHDGTMWTGTQEGLFALDHRTADIKKHITREDGLPADNTVSFDFSPVSESFWVGTNRGLVELNPADYQVLQTITRQDGLIDNEVWLYGSVKAGQNGSIYFGTANGLSIFHPGRNTQNTTPPVLQLTSADILYPSEGRNEVNFEYAALSFGNVPQVRYQTRLLGYDDTWSNFTPNVQLRYTNLPAYLWPKTYTLEVNAINESGVESEVPLVFSFLIYPVWWLTWWAFLIYLSIFLISGFIVDRIQRAKLIKKERDAARLREAELMAESATARSKAAEAQAKALEAENERKAIELEKAQELEVAYHELKAAQSQLIQAEKMASLGRLSTGIAHEIKNPLNFINNFAEVSNELVDELIEAFSAGDQDEIDFILKSLKHNSTKIEEHGKRADSIVKSMMQHARGGKSTFEMLDLNNMVQKFTDLAYHGKRAQYPDFNTSITIDLDPNIKQVKMVGQEIGQVLLNIIGNSIDAVWDYKKKNNGSYEPEISIKTIKKEKSVQIQISDNGPGIPEEIREKIFEPFFTTKPTGEGTGLGLSLSYDIITQGHNGTLTLKTEPGKGASFIIVLPNS